MPNSAHSAPRVHTEALLRQRLATLLSPEALRVLELHYEPQNGGLVVGCLEIPCWLQLAPEGSGTWAFSCPWWQTLIPEDKWFETRVLAEIGKTKMRLDETEQSTEPARVN